MFLCMCGGLLLVLSVCIKSSFEIVIIILNVVFLSFIRFFLVVFFPPQTGPNHKCHTIHLHKS